jgi:hypothetical protein
MISHKNIEQGSIEWFELKWGKIGGTLSKGLFVNSDTLFIDILSQREEDFEPSDSYENDAMERGTEMEPFAKEYLEKYLGVTFENTGWLQSEENELLGISPDGITKDETISFEAKCLGRKNHRSIVYDNEIPLDKIHQCVHYFTVNPKLKDHYFIAFRPEAKSHFIKKLTLDSVINMGTKAKPVLLTVESWKIKALNLANELLIRIKEEENKSQF